MNRFRLRDPASALTHFIGALLAIAGLVVLIVRGVRFGTPWHVVSFAIFGGSMVLLYLASSLYHAVIASPRTVLTLRKLDHIMIYVLIAGTYTPFCLVTLRGAWGWSLLGVVWGAALIGGVVKLFWMSAPRWFTAGVYVAMGWVVVVAAQPLVQRATPDILIWLAAGGLLYTIGAVFYTLKWPNPWPGKFGFHEVWHLFVMGGTASHFIAVMAMV